MSAIESDLWWPRSSMPNRPSSTNTVIAAGSNTTSRHVLNSNTFSGLRMPSLTGMSTSTILYSSLFSTEPFTHRTPLERDEDDNLIDPCASPTEYPCAFPFLGCRETRPSRHTWLKHNLMHFKRKPPPPTATCPICSNTFYNPPRTPCDGDGDGGATAWDQRMECLASHIEEGAGMERAKTDLKLVEYMFQKRAISVIDYQEIVQNGGLPVLSYERGSRTTKLQSKPAAEDFTSSSLVETALDPGNRLHSMHSPVEIESGQTLDPFMNYSFYDEDRRSFQEESGMESPIENPSMNYSFYEDRRYFQEKSGMESPIENPFMNYSFCDEDRRYFQEKSGMESPIEEPSDGSDDDGLFFWTHYFESDSEFFFEGSHTLDSLRVSLAHKLLEEFQARCDGFRANGSNHDGSPQHSRPEYKLPKTNESGTSPKGKCASLKRGRDGKSPDDGDGPRKFRLQTKGDSDEKELFLACPFYKRNPVGYRRCNKHILRDISRVKQHLARQHRIPIHCPLCSTIFKSEELRDDHVRECGCAKLPPKQWEGINGEQKKQLERRVSSRNTREENWYIIYEILFPGAERPKSPYLDPTFADALHELRSFAARELPGIYHEAITHESPEMVSPEGFDIHTFTESVFQRAFELLLDRFESRRASDNSPTASQQQDNPSGDSGYSGSPLGDHIDDRTVQAVSDSLPLLDLEAEDAFPSWLLDCEWNLPYGNPCGRDFGEDSTI